MQRGEDNFSAVSERLKWAWPQHGWDHFAPKRLQHQHDRDHFGAAGFRLRGARPEHDQDELGLIRFQACRDNFGAIGVRQ